VLSGPFRGMSLSELTRREHLGPFLLGTYEAELHPWIEQVSDRQYPAVLDIGAKFGYYAVGLARYMRDTSVIAFDTDPWARRATREMAAVNDTSNVSIAGYCSPRWLDRHLQPGSLVISDCEGFESELFLEARTPALDSATLIIEVHDSLAPGVGAAIRQRFTRTHDISMVTEMAPVTPDADLNFLSAEEARTAVREIRGPQEWLRLTPKVS
jgi:ribosomal protein L11 methylase PrmA